MEYVEGEDLAQRMAHGRVQLDDALQFARQIAEALEAAHERGIVHRDLKPANVKVAPDGTVKVLDFGLAVSRDIDPGGAAMANSPTFTSPALMTQAGVILGTAAYMAPEQARGKVVDRRADIWAFGCVLYEMLCGAKPFDGDSLTDVLSAIVSREPDWTRVPPAVPLAVVALMKRCLNKDPRHRLRDIGEARIILEHPHETLSVTSPASQSRSTRRLLLASALVIAVAAVGAGGFWIGGRGAQAGEPRAPLTFKRLTFDAGVITGARFAPDGVTVVYSSGEGVAPARLFMTRLDGVGSSRLALPDAELQAVSPSAELAITTSVLDRRGTFATAGTLARAPLFGGLPRPVVGDVTFADWHPVDGQLAIAVRGARNRLEFPVGRVLFESDGDIGSPRFSRDGRHLAFIDWPVKNDDRGTVAVIDLAGGAKRTISTTWEGVRTLAWSPDGEEVWYSATSDGGEYRFQASRLDGAQRLLAATPVTLLLQDVRPDGKALAYQFDGRIRVGMLSRGDDTERDLSWLARSFARAFSPDGRQVTLSYAGQGAGHNYAVFLRGVDGSDAVRIGDGEAQGFSPDGRWVLSVIHGPPARVVLLPTGTGEAQTVPTGAVEVSDARFLGDGKRLIFIGTEPGHARRAYVGDLTGSLRPISPENISFESNMLAVARDGRVALRGADQIVRIHSVDGQATTITGLAPEEMPVAWVDDDQAWLTISPGSVSVVDRVDVRSSKRERWITLRPPDPLLLRLRPSLVFSRDGRSYLANYQEVRTRLFLVEGLR